jgi:hypothetical protein
VEVPLSAGGDGARGGCCISGRGRGRGKGRRGRDRGIGGGEGQCHVGVKVGVGVKEGGMGSGWDERGGGCNQRSTTTTNAGNASKDAVAAAVSRSLLRCLHRSWWIITIKIKPTTF